MTEMTSAATANTAANPPRSSPLRILCLQTTRGSGTAEQTWLTEHTLLKCTEQQQCYFWLLIPLDVNTITAYAQELRDFLDESEPTERRTFIKSFVKEIVVMPGSALLRYTIPISQSTPKAAVLVGGRFACDRVRSGGSTGGRATSTLIAGSIPHRWAYVDDR